MAHSPFNWRRPSDIAELNQREWSPRARTISRENTGSTRFSSSYISSLREDSRSFRLNFTTSSTASSPGYNLKEEIEPSTYSFTSALRGTIGEHMGVFITEAGGFCKGSHIVGSSWMEIYYLILDSANMNRSSENMHAKVSDMSAA